MKIAILETVFMQGGHEVDFDRILVEELKELGHEAVFLVPENFKFKMDYQVPVKELAGGEAVNYAEAQGIKKIWFSLQREKRRSKWFDSAFTYAEQGLCDAIILPTTTYRYAKALLKSKLKKSPVPVLFILHGISSHEKAKVIAAAKKCEAYPNIYFVNLTVREENFPKTLVNIKNILPPVYTPRDLQEKPEFSFHSPLRLGFFGQYRREKSLDFFLQAFIKAKFQVPVQLTVQGATNKSEDSEDFARLIAKYQAYSEIVFIHKNLIGQEWQKALLAVDVILMPYAAERYRYHWSAMLFNAIGYYKPVLQSPEINPEVLDKYQLGEALHLESEKIFTKQLEGFVNSFSEKASAYCQALEAANLAFAPNKFVEKLLKICGEVKH